jgi:hypothetical protein
MDLAFQITITGMQFIRLRVAITWRAAFYHICDKNLAAVDARTLQQFI